MDRSLRVTLVTVVAFGIHFIFDDVYFKSIRGSINEVIEQFGISHIVAYLIVGIPIFAGTLLISKRNKFFHNLGLNKSFLQALVFAVVCTLPMFIGFAFFFDFNPDIKLNTLLVSILAAAFFEELYFRGFLFGQLYKHTSQGFIASVLLGALLFGLIHLYQSNNFNELIGIFLVTFLGAILFAWVYVEWDYNLWVPILLHLFMNLAWEVYSAGDNALGGAYSNVFRTLTIVLIITTTILYKKWKGIPLEINRSTFLMRKQNIAIAVENNSLSTKSKVTG
ncbi:CPBP family intramembrane glutamic endopeptidase [Pontibacter korlensis]|uniref:CPBP family intramembrane glutamic endopeptidase n=1 Tax=Pontibacter korlensis TaxID=400092 RepID=UPI0006969348|nr:CPBP family intramembrane glutamic endopeptidase [Pontibacter korlensis]